MEDVRILLISHYLGREQLELKHKLITTDELTFDVGENNENSSLKCALRIYL